MPMSFKRCPSCKSPKVVAAVETGEFIYFRCSDCVDVWSIPERRNMLREMTEPPVDRAGAERRRVRYAVH
jgi:transposase-like protein